MVNPFINLEPFSYEDLRYTSINSKNVDPWEWRVIKLFLVLP